MRRWSSSKNGRRFENVDDGERRFRTDQGPNRVVQAPALRAEDDLMPALHPFLDTGHAHPIAIAHRGYSARHPENTMAAFAAAIEIGYQFIETDVHATADGVLIAFHDDRLDRVTDRVGLIRDLDWSEIRRARVESQEPIPLLDELLATWPTARVNIDPKTDDAVEPLLAILERHDAWDRVCVGSFSGARLTRMRKVAGDRLCTSMGPLDVTRLRLASFRLPVGAFAANCVQVPPSNYGLTIVDRRFVRAAHSRGMPVHVWTINDEEEMNRFLDVGVDGIVTDEAERLKEALVSRAMWPG